jgi:hypothetical protein
MGIFKFLFKFFGKQAKKVSKMGVKNMTFSDLEEVGIQCTDEKEANRVKFFQDLLDGNFPFDMVGSNAVIIKGKQFADSFKAKLDEEKIKYSDIEVKSLDALPEEEALEYKKKLFFKTIPNKESWREI